VILPSVTQAIGPFADFSRVSPAVLDAAAARGTAVHEAAAAHAQGLWVPPLPEELAGYFNSFRRWFDATVVEVIGVELEVKDEALGYIGHLDLAAVLKGDDVITIIDYKTPATKNKLWAAQLAAYLHAFQSTPWPWDANRIASLRLKKDGGRAIFDEYTNSHQDFAAFVAALTAYKWFKEDK
jgi:hypothetical protein